MLKTCRRLSIALLLLSCVPGCQKPSTIRSTETISGRTMGTTYTVKYEPASGTASLTDIGNLIELALESVNAQMSNYREDSEISRFNATYSQDWFPVSRETAEVVSLALQIYEMTEGSFDVTVGPLVDLWGFGPKETPEERPSDSQIQELLQSVGSDKLEARLDPPALRKLSEKLRVDLSAIAKGHGVDRVASALSKIGLEQYFVEIGGEIRTKGQRHDGRAWQVGIERPSLNQREVLQVVGISGISMATSGDYRNLRKVGEDVVTHFIDPRTGFPLRSEVAAATVLATDCATADAIATGLMSAGKEKALRLVEQHDWAALLVLRHDNQLETVASPRFSQLTSTGIVPDNVE